MKIAIFGANGQLGSDLVEILGGFDHQLICLDESHLDATALNAPIPTALLQGAELIINTSAYTRVDDAEDHIEKAFLINAAFAARVAMAARDLGCPLIHFSTDYVFSGDTDSAYTENDPTSPKSIYGISKEAAERAVRAYANKHYIFRISSLFGRAGSSGKGGNFVETMIRIVQQQKPLRVVADQTMTPTHTLDVARTIAKIVAHLPASTPLPQSTPTLGNRTAMIAATLRHDTIPFGTYHLCGTGSCTWFEFASEIFYLIRQAPSHALLGISTNPVDLSPTSTAEYKTKAPRPANSAMSNEAISRYFAMPHWRDSLKEYLTLKGHRSTSKADAALDTSL